MTSSQSQAHQYNIDAAQRELDSRDAQGEDVSLLRVCQGTAQIVEADDEWFSQFDGCELSSDHYAGF